MKTLVIETATEACSVALFEDKRLLAGEHRMLGRGHAELLVPMISELPGKGKAERIAVSLGPGSFTGVRIGLAAARALALAWKAECLGYPTLALVAAIARERCPGPVSVCMTGGHGEWFLQDFADTGAPQGKLVSLPPAAAAASAAHDLVAGTQAEALVGLRNSGEAMPIWPNAGKFPLLAPMLLTAELSPIYGRGPDARLPGQAA
ncbi:MAG TPA: tRNA (adenosine(37)-N6)-threonylcarbamoyltransferase complex dimerization subunit type 1 TsaB [Sphingomonadaceae bacterium]|nr:tRNA (adenosine(37)-N6)-threonylcarbamoyltransferase complex dimerization subunit type 1 TsaB [Sphingomonadaceae bacterium]